jgi:hypothetical protein
MIIESELRREIAQVVARSASLADLYRWLMARNWNVLRNSDAAAVDLAGEVEELLFLRSDGHLRDEEAIDGLGKLLNNIVASAPMDVSRELVAARPRFINSEHWRLLKLRPVAA